MGGVLEREECEITDSLIDETIKSLADELKLCLDLKKQLQIASRQDNHIPGVVSGEDEGMIFGGTKHQVNLPGVDTKIKAEEGADGKTNHATKFSK